MDHVDAHDRIGARNRPVIAGGIEFERVEQVFRPLQIPPCRDRAQRLWRGIARLPSQAEKRAGEMHRMFASAARHFKHEAAFGQFLAQNGKDRLAVARCGGRGLARPTA